MTQRNRSSFTGEFVSRQDYEFLDNTAYLILPKHPENDAGNVSSSKGWWEEMDVNECRREETM